MTVTALGRGLRRRTAQKHSIKRVDRLVGNGRLHREQAVWYRAIARRLLTRVSRPLLLIDWTDVKGHVALVASVPNRGRSIPVYSEVHSKKRYGNRDVIASFLRTLESIVPARCRPILVADAGFQSTFWQMVNDMGWGFVVRVRNRRRVIRGVRYPELLERASGRAVDLGRWDARHSYDRWRLVLCKKPRRQRRAKHKSRNEAAYRDRHKEAWLLVTNEHQASASEVVLAYAQRMQIEETFRDLKSIRFGWGFEHAKTNSASRIDVMILIATLATFVTVMAVLVAEQRGLARLFQANTTRRRVLSLVSLGRAVLNHTAPFQASIHDFVRPFRQQLRALFPQLPNREFIDYDIYPF